MKSQLGYVGPMRSYLLGIRILRSRIGISERGLHVVSDIFAG